MQRVRSLLENKETPLKWLFYGDSITHGARHTFGGRDYTEHFSERVRTELGRPRDIVIKTAISGNTTENLLKDFDWRCGQFQPHVVFLMIGMNDCSTGRNLPLETFEANLHELCNRIEGLGALTVLQTTCPILPGTAPDREPNFPAYMEAIRRVACARQLPLVDHEAYWKENIGRHFFWMSNAFHPNQYGHTAFAHELFRALGIFDPASPTCSLYVP